LDYTKRTPLKDSEVALLFAAMVIVFVGVSVLVHGHCTRSLTFTRSTQTVLPSADTAGMLFCALLASGQINMRKVDGWQTLSTKPIDQPIDLAA